MELYIFQVNSLHVFVVILAYNSQYQCTFYSHGTSECVQCLFMLSYIIKNLKSTNITAAYF